METIETNNLIFEDYTNAPYFKDIVFYVDEHEQEILDFFKLSELPSKWKARFLPFEEFKNYIISYCGKYEDYVSGLTSRKEKTVSLLNVEDREKYSNHKNSDLMQVCKVLIHEFVHVCYGEAVDKPIMWIDDGLAQYLSHQDKELIDVSNEDFSFMKNNFYDYPDKCYKYSYYVVKYMFENYQEDEINKLIFDKEYLISKQNDLFEETKKWIKEQIKQREKTNLS